MASNDIFETKAENELTDEVPVNQNGIEYCNKSSLCDQDVPCVQNCTDFNINLKEIDEDQIKSNLIDIDSDFENFCYKLHDENNTENELDYKNCDIESNNIISENDNQSECHVAYFTPIPSPKSTSRQYELAEDPPDNVIEETELMLVTKTENSKSYLIEFRNQVKEKLNSILDNEKTPKDICNQISDLNVETVIEKIEDSVINDLTYTDNILLDNTEDNCVPINVSSPVHENKEDHLNKCDDGNQISTGITPDDIPLPSYDAVNILLPNSLQNKPLPVTTDVPLTSDDKFEVTDNKFYTENDIDTPVLSPIKKEPSPLKPVLGKEQAKKRLQALLKQTVSYDAVNILLPNSLQNKPLPVTTDIPITSVDKFEATDNKFYTENDIDTPVLSPIKKEPSPLKPVLGKEQAKKRLQALLKQTNIQGKKKILSPVKMPKIHLSIKSEDHYDENGEKIEEKYVLVKKPPKKGPCPQEKAKAVISEIEEMKRREAGIYFSSFSQHVPVVHISKIPSTKRNKLTKDEFNEKIDEINTDRSQQKNEDRGRKKYRHSERETSSRRKSSSEKTKTDVVENIPESWTVMKERGLKIDVFKNINKNKLRRLKDDDHRRKIEIHLKAFDGEIIMRKLFSVKSIKDEEKYFPYESVMFTNKHPKISYCENFKHCRDFYPNRERVFSVTTEERKKIMTDVLNYNTRNKSFNLKMVPKVRSWYTVSSLLETENCKEHLLNDSYGLAVLSESYNNIAEESEEEIAETSKLKDKKPESPKTPKERNKKSKEKSELKLKELTSKNVEKDLKPKSVEKELTSKNVEKDLKPKSVEKELTSKSVEKDLKPKSVEKELTSKSVEKELKPKSVEKDLTSKSVEKELKPKSAEKDLTSKSVEKELKLKSVEKESRRKSVEKESSRKSVEKESRRKSVEKEFKSKSAEKEIKSKSVEKELKLKSVEKDLKSNSVEKELKSKSVEKESKRNSVEKEFKTKSVEKEINSKSVEKEFKSKSVEKDLKLKSIEKELKSFSVEKELKSKSVEKELKSKSVEKELKLKSVEKELKSFSVEKELKSKSVDRELKSKSVEKEPKTEIKNIEFSPRTPEILNDSAKTPDTDEYQSDWEMGKNLVIPELGKTLNLHNSGWESEEELDRLKRQRNDYSDSKKNDRYKKKRETKKDRKYLDASPKNRSRSDNKIIQCNNDLSPYSYRTNKTYEKESKGSRNLGPINLDTLSNESRKYLESDKYSSKRSRNEKDRRFSDEFNDKIYDRNLDKYLDELDNKQQQDSFIFDKQHDWNEDSDQEWQDRFKNRKYDRYRSREDTRNDSRYNRYDGYFEDGYRSANITYGSWDDECIREFRVKEQKQYMQEAESKNEDKCEIIASKGIIDPNELTKTDADFKDNSEKPDESKLVSEYEEFMKTVGFGEISVVSDVCSKEETNDKVCGEEIENKKSPDVSIRINEDEMLEEMKKKKVVSKKKTKKVSSSSSSSSSGSDSSSNSSDSSSSNTDSSSSSSSSSSESDDEEVYRKKKKQKTEINFSDVKIKTEKISDEEFDIGTKDSIEKSHPSDKNIKREKDLVPDISIDTEISYSPKEKYCEKSPVQKLKSIEVPTIPCVVNKVIKISNVCSKDVSSPAISIDSKNSSVTENDKTISELYSDESNEVSQSELRTSPVLEKVDQFMPIPVLTSESIEQPKLIENLEPEIITESDSKDIKQSETNVLRFDGVKQVNIDLLDILKQSKENIPTYDSPKCEYENNNPIETANTNINITISKIEIKQNEVKPYKDSEKEDKTSYKRDDNQKQSSKRHREYDDYKKYEKGDKWSNDRTKRSRDYRYERRYRDSEKNRHRRSRSRSRSCSLEKNKRPSKSGRYYESSKRRDSSQNSSRSDQSKVVEKIPLPDLDGTNNSSSMEVSVQSPNSPQGGLKRSLADSTISDSELLLNDENNYYSHPPRNKYIRDSLYKSPVELSPSTDSPKSPKRISLDDRIKLALGIQEEVPKKIDTVYAQGSYANYSDYNKYPSFDGFDNTVKMHNQSNYYSMYHDTDRALPVGPQILQVGNVLQVVPTEMPSDMKQITSSSTNKAPITTTKVVQVGNMLQIVPAPVPPVILEENTATKTVEYPSNVTQVISKTPLIHPDIAAEILKHKQEKEKRRAEREQRRKERQQKRLEKENRRDLRMKRKTENMIKRALQQDTGNEEGNNVENNAAVEPTIAWPPPALVSVPLPEPPAKGILVTSGFGKLGAAAYQSPTRVENPEETKIRKAVKFADGIKPGEGTSPSGGEDLPSPPPPPRKLPKEQRYKKTKLRHKKKVKVKIIRTAPVVPPPEPVESDDSEDNLPPPPPPPGSPPPHLWPPRTEQCPQQQPAVAPSYGPPFPIPGAMFGQPPQQMYPQIPQPGFHQPGVPPGFGLAGVRPSFGSPSNGVPRPPPPGGIYHPPAFPPAMPITPRQFPPGFRHEFFPSKKL